MTFLNKLISLLFLFTTAKSFSQETGYKDLKIGSNLFDRKLIAIYKYSRYKSDSTMFHLESIAPQFICDEKISYLDIKIKTDSSIDYIHLYTQEIIIKDVDDYFNKYKEITNCIANTIGKASYYEDGNDRDDGRMIMAWTFSDNIVMSLYTYSPSIYDKDIKRRYKFAWFKTTDDKKMW